jgi:hypothetical protein
MPLVQRILVPPKEKEKHEYDELDEVLEEEKGGDNIEHEEFLHPNAMKASEYDSS